MLRGASPVIAGSLFGVDTKMMVSVGRAALETAGRRALRGPRRLGWSHRYETMVRLMREGFAGELDLDDPKSLRRARHMMDGIGRRTQGGWLGSFTPLDVGGVPGARVRPTRPMGPGRVLYLHGGGYIVGSTNSHRGLMATVAHHAGVEVIGIDYRLAPEHPCPAGLEDAVAAYRALVETSASESGAGTGIVIGGDSAGGGLTLATLQAIREAGLPQPAGAVLFSPWADLSDGLEVRNPDVGVDYITMRGGDRIAGRYAGALDRNDWQVSPLLGDLTGLCPMLCIAGGDETIVRDSERLETRARAAGVKVHLHVEPGEVHVYPAFAPINPRGQVAMGRVGQWITERLAG